MQTPARPCDSRRSRSRSIRASLEKALAKKPFLAHYAGPEELKNLGHALGQEFVAGKDTPLWNALRSSDRRGDDRAVEDDRPTES